MIKTLIISVLLTSSVFAEDCVDCGQELKHATDITTQVDALQKTAAVDCEAVLQSDVDKEYDELYSKSPRKTGVVGGLTLSGTQDELKFAKLMIGDKPMSSWSKASSCKTVVCALTKMYDSAESAKRTLNIAKRNGYIVSAGKVFEIENKAIGQLFSNDELRSIDLAYKKLSANFRKIRTLDTLKRMPNGYGKPGSPTAAAYASPGYKDAFYSSEGEIVFISSAFNGDKSWASMVAVHELAHHLDFAKSSKTYSGYSESPEFLKLSGWKLEKKYETQNGKKVLVESWKRPDDKGFVRDYAGSEPAEDFAEAVAYYVYEPDKLRDLDPEKYNFVKNKIFNGQEFDKDVDLKKTKEEILARCLADTKKISLYGYSFGDVDYFSGCLDNFVKEFEFTEPAMCSLNSDLVEVAAMGKIRKELDSYNQAIVSCNNDIKKLQGACYAENNFQKNCVLEKCNIPQALSSKIVSSPIYGQDKLALDALKKKVGKSKYLATLLIAGFTEGKAVSKSYSLAHQKSFADNAVKGILQLMDKENIKVDQSKNLESDVYYDLVISKDTAPLIDSFEEFVTENSSKSKDKNLDLIKKWWAAQSFPESPQLDALAESMTKLGR